MSKISMKELGKRLVVSAISIFIVGLFIYFSQNSFFKPVFALLLAVVSATGVYEYVKLVERKNVFLKKRLMIFACFFQIFSFYVYSQIIGFKFLPLLVFFIIIFIFFLSLFSEIEGATSHIGLSTFGILYIVVPLGLLFPILYLQEVDGRFWLVYLIAVTKIADIGAYFGGKLLGRHKLAKNISPNKTVEGAIVGLLCSIATSYLFYCMFSRSAFFYLNQFQPIMFLALGAILGILGQIGDLAESLLKRDANIKDSSTIPGFGGILDMLDSLLFNIPLFYFFLEVVI
jgi:phosphatidate cytidylyltransferase